jgi:hypothetical protein
MDPVMKDVRVFSFRSFDMFGDYRPWTVRTMLLGKVDGTPGDIVFLAINHPTISRDDYVIAKIHMNEWTNSSGTISVGKSFVHHIIKPEPKPRGTKTVSEIFIESLFACLYQEDAVEVFTGRVCDARLVGDQDFERIRKYLMSDFPSHPFGHHLDKKAVVESAVYQLPDSAHGDAKYGVLLEEFISPRYGGELAQELFSHLIDLLIRNHGGYHVCTCGHADEKGNCTNGDDPNGSTFSCDGRKAHPSDIGPFINRTQREKNVAKLLTDKYNDYFVEQNTKALDRKERRNASWRRSDAPSSVLDGFLRPGEIVGVANLTPTTNRTKVLVDEEAAVRRARLFAEAQRRVELEERQRQVELDGLVARHLAEESIPAQNDHELALALEEQERDQIVAVGSERVGVQTKQIAELQTQVNELRQQLSVPRVVNNYNIAAGASITVNNTINVVNNVTNTAVFARMPSIGVYGRDNFIKFPKYFNALREFASTHMGRSISYAKFEDYERAGDFSVIHDALRDREKKALLEYMLS